MLKSIVHCTCHKTSKPAKKESFAYNCCYNHLVWQSTLIESIEDVCVCLCLQVRRSNTDFVRWDAPSNENKVLHNSVRERVSEWVGSSRSAIYLCALCVFSYEKLCLPPHS